MRIPLPVKLMISYLVIVTIGAGPTFVYVRAKLQADLMAEAASVLIARGRRVARVIGVAPPAERMAQLRILGETSVDRLSFLSSRGEVIYDNEPMSIGTLENHLGRPEVGYALGNLAAERVSFVGEVHDADGVGISRRVSTTNGIDTLYIAIHVNGTPGETIGVLRLATPLERIDAMTSRMVRFARNAQAVAVSLAIGFSLLAAIFFVRPLQRVRKMVHALAAGDIGAQVGRLGNDEVGDVGRALDQMAMSLRRRLLAAGLGEALLAQLVEALPTPCVVFEERGDVVAMNGPARRGLCLEGAEAGKRMTELAAHPRVQRAVQAAEDEGEPEPLELPIGESGVVRGSMHVLKRPGMAPLRVFIGADVPTPEQSLLPLPEEVRMQRLDAVFELARKTAEPALRRAGVVLEMTQKLSHLLVADARDQLGLALGEALVAAATTVPHGQSVLRIEAVEEATRVRLELDAPLSEAAVGKIKRLVEPVGGAVEYLSDETKLWLPKA